MTQLELFDVHSPEELEKWIGELKVDKPEKEDTMGQFKGWGSTPRWHKGLTVTEKINGTNACVLIYDGQVKAQSRKRMITPDDDNYGFAKWVYDNAGVLMDTLGFGYHYGEWFGPGIQGNPLGVESKRFALFHATKYTEDNGYELNKVDGLETVPLLFHGQANWMTIGDILQGLDTWGTNVTGAKSWIDEETGFSHSAAAEGIIVWHKETQQKYKILLEDDAFHKWEIVNGR